MKRLTVALFSVIIGFSLANPIFAYKSPGASTGYINDFSGLFTTEQKLVLEDTAKTLEITTGVQIAVVTVQNLGDESIETYAVKLFEEWGIGSKKSDTGLLVLLAPHEQKVRIEVGYGLEGTITDAQASDIIRTTMTPFFKRGEYFKGVHLGIGQLQGLIVGDPTITAGVNNSSKKNSGIDYSHVLFVILIVGINIISIMARSKSWWLGGIIGIVFGAIFGGVVGGIIFGLLGFIIDFILSRYGKDWFSGGGSGGMWFPPGGRGFGGGGFGGFGGGRSGGGGSSGSW